MSAHTTQDLSYSCEDTKCPRPAGPARPRGVDRADPTKGRVDAASTAQRRTERRSPVCHPHKMDNGDLSEGFRAVG